MLGNVFSDNVVLDIGKQPTANCAHCRPGVPCDPFSGACMESKSKSYFYLIVKTNFTMLILIVLTLLIYYDALCVLANFYQILMKHIQDFVEASLYSCHIHAMDVSRTPTIKLASLRLLIM